MCRYVPAIQINCLLQWLFVSLLWMMTAEALAEEKSRYQGDLARHSAGLMVLYDFHQVDGNRIPDVSGVKPVIDLDIIDGKHLRIENGVLKVDGKTKIASQRSASELGRGLQSTNELTVEAWIKADNLKQDGPARIVTISRNPSERNLTLGQENDRFDVRLRTTRTSKNGLPSLNTDKNVVKPRLQHVIYTRNRSGTARIFVDGRLVQETQIDGNFANWDGDYRIGLANELTGDRIWQGEIHLVAIYRRSLSPREILDLFQAGPDANRAGLARQKSKPNAELFERQIARILANHCLECHDPATNKGGLDLSRKVTAFAESDSGKTILPGQPDESLLWQYVESDEMPRDRSPLSTQHKQALKQWIEGGATWTFETIDPALYQHQSDGVRTFVRRLTVEEFIETVRVLFDVDIGDEARALLPPDLRADGFNNTGYNLTVDLGHVDAYAQLAEMISRRVDVKKFAGRFERSRSLTDNNMRRLIETMGRWVLRGPLARREIDLYRGISTTVASAGGDFEEAVRLILQAMIQSPSFIYIMEKEQGVGDYRFVTEYELANRLSYMIWGGPPDQSLLDSAGNNQLHEQQQLRKQVARMLNDPRARRHSRQFIIQWLNLNRLDHLRPDPERFPKWTPQLADDMQRETVEYFDDVIWEQQRPLADLLNAQVTYLSPALARHYGLTPRTESFARYDLQSIPSRGGLLTQGSLLTIGGDDASMVTRGLFVLHDLLRGTVKDPPPCVDTTPVPTKPGQTNRDVSEMRLKNVACGGCHARFEPLAFGLEKFDGLGTYREKDQHGNQLHEDGEILIPGTAKPLDYETSAELMNLLAASKRVQESLTWKVVQFCLGRPLLAADAREVRRIHEVSQTQGGTWKSTIAALATSDLVLKSPIVLEESEESR